MTDSDYEKKGYEFEQGRRRAEQENWTTNQQSSWKVGVLIFGVLGILVVLAFVGVTYLGL